MVSSGDNYLAGPEFNASLVRGVPHFDAIALDLIGYDALAIGNHEFDFGPDVLADFIESFGRPGQERFLSANLDLSGEPRLSDLERRQRIGSSRVVTRGGRRIGIVGATTTDLPFISSPRNVIANAVAPAVQLEVDRLTRDRVEIIVLISHLQSINADLALIPMLRNLDIAVAGGGDDLLANSDRRHRRRGRSDVRSRRAAVVVAGDLNTFEWTNDLTEILPGGDRILKDLLGEMEDDDRYSFIFDGNSQLLDHIFASRRLLYGAEFDVVHVNADFPVLFGEVAASDHDPLLARFELR